MLVGRGELLLGSDIEENVILSRHFREIVRQREDSDFRLCALYRVEA